LIVSCALRLGTAAALSIDAAVHLHNAAAYDDIKATFTQGGLFRFEAGVAIAAALLVLVWPRRSAWALALLVAASALATVLVYRYVDIGKLCPFPNMYKNTWDVPGKLLSAYAGAPPWSWPQRGCWCTGVARGLTCVGRRRRDRRCVNGDGEGAPGVTNRRPRGRGGRGRPATADRGGCYGRATAGWSVCSRRAAGTAHRA
jgi:hypothetical protein